MPVYHTNRRPIKNTIGVVMNRPVGMALKTAHYNVMVAYPTANAMLGAAVGIDK